MMIVWGCKQALEQCFSNLYGCRDFHGVLLKCQVHWLHTQHIWLSRSKDSSVERIWQFRRHRRRRFTTAHPEGETTATPNILAWAIHGQEGLTSYSPWGHQKPDTQLSTSARSDKPKTMCISMAFLEVSGGTVRNHNLRSAKLEMSFQMSTVTTICHQKKSIPERSPKWMTSWSPGFGLGYFCLSRECLFAG